MTLYLTIKKIQLAASKIFEKYKKIAHSKKGKTQDITSIKQVSIHLRERMKRKRKVKREITTLEDIIFVKQVLLHVEID